MDSSLQNPKSIPVMLFVLSFILRSMLLDHQSININNLINRYYTFALNKIKINASTHLLQM